MTAPGIKNNSYTDQQIKKLQPEYMKSYPLSVILTINLEPAVDTAYEENNKADTSIKDIILDKIKKQLQAGDRIEHLLDYNFRVVINDRLQPTELPDLCKKLVSSIGLKGNKSNNRSHKKRIILHFITLTKLYAHANKKNNSHHPLKKNNGYPSSRFFDVSATNSNGEIPC